MSNKGVRYSPETRERAIRMVEERRSETTSAWAATVEVSSLLGMKAETLRRWIRRAEVDGGLRPGLTTNERDRLRQLEKENRDLRRANGMADSTGRSNASCEMNTRLTGGHGCRASTDISPRSRRNSPSGFAAVAGD